jgi:hypothetical protein
MGAGSPLPPPQPRATRELIFTHIFYEHKDMHCVYAWHEARRLLD